METYQDYWKRYRKAQERREKETKGKFHVPRFNGQFVAMLNRKQWQAHVNRLKTMRERHEAISRKNREAVKVCTELLLTPEECARMMEPKPSEPQKEKPAKRRRKAKS